MPIYSFKLRSDENVFADDAGVSLLNPKLAYSYACDVVRELMRRRESETRYWSLEVHEQSQGKIFDIRLKEGSREQVERLAKEVLTNPVIEEYRIIWE